MAFYRIKAAGSNNAALNSVIAKVCSIASQNQNTDLLFLVSQIQVAKDDDRIEQIFGEDAFKRLVKKRESISTGVGIKIELQPYDYLKNNNHRAHGRTVVVLNPSVRDLGSILQTTGASINWIVVEMHMDGELDSWVQTNKASDI